MSSLKMNPDAIEQRAHKFLQAAAELHSISEQVAHLVSALDWQVREQAGVEGKISHAASGGKRLAAEVERLGQYMQGCVLRFREADSQSLSGFTEMDCRMAAVPTAEASMTVAAFAAGCVSKTDWLTKLLNKLHATTEQKKNAFRSAYPPNVGTNYTGSGECKGFATKYYKEVYGIDVPETHQVPVYDAKGNAVKEWKDGHEVPVYRHTYELNVDSNSPITQQNQISQSDLKADSDEAKKQIIDTFQNAKDGDFVQLYGNESPHSAIFEGYEKNDKGEITGIKLYDANWEQIPDKRIVQVHTMTLDYLLPYLRSDHAGVTVYSPKAE